MLNGERLKKNKGSIVLEAAISLPIFLTFILSLITLIQISIAEIALQTAVSETVKQVSAHYTPVGWLQNAGNQRASDQLDRLALPGPIREWVDGLLKQSVDKVTPILFEPLLHVTADRNVLEKDRLHIRSVKLPDLSGSLFFEMEAEYVLPLKLPFIHKEIILRKVARERVWLGGVEM